MQRDYIRAEMTVFQMASAGLRVRVAQDDPVSLHQLSQEPQGRSCVWPLEETIPETCLDLRLVGTLGLGSAWSILLAACSPNSWDKICFCEGDHPMASLSPSTG